MAHLLVHLDAPLGSSDFHRLVGGKVPLRSKLTPKLQAMWCGPCLPILVPATTASEFFRSPGRLPQMERGRKPVTVRSRGLGPLVALPFRLCTPAVGTSKFRAGNSPRKRAEEEPGQKPFLPTMCSRTRSAAALARSLTRSPSPDSSSLCHQHFMPAKTEPRPSDTIELPSRNHQFRGPAGVSNDANVCVDIDSDAMPSRKPAPSIFQQSILA